MCVLHVRTSQFELAQKPLQLVATTLDRAEPRTFGMKSFGSHIATVLHLTAPFLTTCSSLLFLSHLSFHAGH